MASIHFVCVCVCVGGGFWDQATKVKVFMRKCTFSSLLLWWGIISKVLRLTKVGRGEEAQRIMGTHQGGGGGGLFSIGGSKNMAWAKGKQDFDNMSFVWSILVVI